MSDIKIALAGNPNSGKTTLFNMLTGSKQYVGNWPGVTVEKKEGMLKGFDNVIIQDLPGIYSLSPYSLEEVITRNYLIDEQPDAILNIVDGTNIERNLYLTTQLIELGIPIVVAVNMMDIVRKTGDKINVENLSKALGCPVVETSALKGDGAMEAARRTVAVANSGENKNIPCHFEGSVEHAIAHIEESIQSIVPKHSVRWYAIKIFERDEKVLEKIKLSPEDNKHIEEHIVECEREMDDDAESIIIGQRYAYIAKLMEKTVKKSNKYADGTVSDKIDRVLTNRVLALPIFFAVMYVVYKISIGTVGDWSVGFMEGLFENIGEFVSGLMEGNVSPVLQGLIVDGAIGGVGSVLTFVPQMIILFLMLAFLEECGYMARVAFIMDRIFRRFGLSGKSFIPMLIGSGCSVPGIMASRTIENERDRRMTIMTTSFIPCGAKMPIVGLIASAVFGGSALIATSAYFLGVAAVIISGVILKKTKAFAGEPAEFVMELPSYHWPTVSGVLRSTWERGWSFIKRAGTIILLSSIAIWFLSSFGFGEEGFGLVEDMNESVLAKLGGSLKWIFTPLGFGNWEAVVATVMGLVAKEEVVNVFGVLSAVGEGAMDILEAGGAEAIEGLKPIGEQFFNGSGLSAYSFLIFNLFCAPCFAAIGAIRREMNNAKWTVGAIVYMTVLAWVSSFVFYNLGLVIRGGAFGINAIIAIVIVVIGAYLLFRPNPYKNEKISIKYGDQ
ncbi:MAG: ferrous iron transport protein B [Christensenellaceae bacterium]|nr:ferrous iron transport protein B [Christensenellaceae bacterium]